VIAPHVAPEQPAPVTLQLTAVLDVPVTVAVNCCRVDVTTVAVAGDTETLIAATKVTVALADFVASAFEVAVTATVEGLGTLAGVLYKPLLLMVPHALPVHPVPATVHVTPVLDDPVTVAVNFRLPPVVTVAEVGEIDTEIADCINTLADPDFVGSAVEVARTVTSAGFGTALGAVYSPVEVIVPHAAPLQPVPLTLHVTPGEVVPVTFATNCCRPPVLIWTLEGVTDTAMGVLIETAAEADFVTSANDVAVTVTWFGTGMTVGAV
jgi:hypothetical protein